MKKVICSFIITAMVFAVVFLCREQLSSVFADFTVSLHGDDEDVREIVKKYENAVIKLEKSKTLEDENRKLRRLLSVKENADLNTITARVISFGNNADYRYLFADCGTDDGVYPGSCVISENGYVGEVCECGENWCGIKTTESEDTEISVTCLGNGKTYLLSGKDKKMRFVKSGDNVMPGQLVVTSGLSDTIPGGLKVGRVMKTEKVSSAEECATVLCFEDFNELSYVLICTGGDGDE